MAEGYITRPGEMLDAICWRVYGSAAVESGRAVEAVLAANLGLGPALEAPILPPDTRLILPDLAVAPTTSDTKASGPAVSGDVALWA